MIDLHHFITENNSTTIETKLTMSEHYLATNAKSSKKAYK